MPKNQKLNLKKMIAPMVITLVIVSYYIGFACVLAPVPDIPLIAKLLGALIPLAFVGVGIYVLIERIKEIKNGEEDDLSKY